VTVRIFAILGLAAAIFAVLAAYTQPAAYFLGRSRGLYWPRHNTRPAGYYYGRDRYNTGYYGSRVFFGNVGGRSRWDPIPTRRSYSNFAGVGPGSGK